MKSTIVLVLLIMGATSALKAQTDAPNDSVQVQEVVVRGARVVNRTDGKMIFPSEEMTKSATSGYNLLRMLPLPNVKVDDISERISAANSLVGAVQVRINDVEASTADIQSLQPREVEKVGFYRPPWREVRRGRGHRHQYHNKKSDIWICHRGKRHAHAQGRHG